MFPEDSADAVESAIMEFIQERKESVTQLGNDPRIRSEIDLLVAVGSSDAFGRFVTFSPELLGELHRSNVFLTVSCVPASD
jgi:hypothetical protein